MLYAKKIKANNTNDSLSLIFDFVNPKSTVLDIGCATGSLAKQLYEQKNCVVYGMEQNKKSVAKSYLILLKIFDYKNCEIIILI